jgi:hypothetical protein
MRIKEVFMIEVKNALRLYRWIKKIRIQYKSIKNNRQLRKDYTQYGINSLIFSFMAVALAMSLYLIGALGNIENSILAIFLLIVLTAFVFVAPLISLAFSLIYSIMQLLLNKSFISWLSIVVFFMATIFTSLIFLSSISIITNIIS